MKQKDFFGNLTWSDLEDWAGSTITSRGRNYQRGGHVRDLACLPEGGLIAWVLGTRKYATRVRVEKGELMSACSCPYAGTCKHAVAVVLEYLERLKANAAVPLAAEADPRLSTLEAYSDDSVWEDDDDEEPKPRKQGGAAPAALGPFLNQMSKEQITALVLDLSDRYADVRQDLQDRQNLATGSVGKMIQAIRAEIEELSEEPGWYHHWNGEGNVPDYSRVQSRLEALLEQGHADEVITLGKELLEKGTRQVEMSEDDGATAMEIGECMEVVFRALPRSSLSPVEQMLRAIGMELSDEYDLCPNTDAFWNRKRSKRDWSLLADKLLERLEAPPKRADKREFSWRHSRDDLTDWIARALKEAGRKEEVLAFCRGEAQLTGNYLRLVENLNEFGLEEEAEQWVRKGIEATHKTAPGDVTRLHDALREMREKAKDWLGAAALLAEDFVAEPSLDGFQKLGKAAKRAKVGDEVREAALRYLETGTLPWAGKSTNKRADRSWPLPETGLFEYIHPRGRRNPPETGVLIDIAISEKKPDEVIRWYDQRKPKADPWGWNHYREDDIAEAIADAYPKRAIAIWKRLAEAQMAVTQVKAYGVAAGYLRKARRVLEKQDQTAEWQAYLSRLRQAHARKRRLMEILDGLSGRRIVDEDR